MAETRKGLYQALVAATIVILVVGSAAVYLELGLRTGHPGVAQTTYTASNSILGIRLTFSLNPSAIRVGDAVNYSASVYNTRPSENNVSSASNWAIPGLIYTATGPTDSPIAFAVMPGHYVSSNISKAPGIDYGMCCTTVMGGVAIYSFQPSSDIASVYAPPPHCNSNPCFTRPVSTWRLLSQYPTGVGGGVHWVSFTAGLYTVVAEDEWGDIALASFTVTQTP